MTGIVEKLRAGFEADELWHPGGNDVNLDAASALLDAAATEIERLTKEVEGLRADKARLDWLEHKTVEVRLPLVHGSRHMFFACEDASFEGELHPSDLRAKIDAALTPREEGA